ncbi:MAG: xanthine dehydrogenase family protein subunit M [Chloroflexota bacterium]
MIPKEFNYVAPSTLDEALAALRDGGDDAKALAGGHSLIPMMKLRLAAPTMLVDLRRINELRRVDTHNGNIEIGSMVTYRTLLNDESIQAACSLLSECAASIGDSQVRSRGTIGGSLAHADPAADLPAAILALDATLLTTAGEIPAADFFTDLFTTSLEPGQIVTGVRVARSSGKSGSAYVKIRNKASHYALVGAAAVLSLDNDSTCNNASIGITGAASKAFRLSAVEDALKGTRLSDQDIEAALGNVGGLDVDWMEDLFGSADYRKHLTGVVTRRAIDTAKSRM